jgi:hypothetical protein
MRFKVVAAAFAAIAAVGLIAAPADAAPKKKRVAMDSRGNAVVDTRGHTVFTSRDEDGRTRTRVIIQKRSYLDPGTERFPGERSSYDYAVLPNHRADGVLDNTIAGSNMGPLPGPWTLPFKDNPWIGGY